MAKETEKEKATDKSTVRQAEIQKSIKDKEKAVRDNKTIQKNG